MFQIKEVVKPSGKGQTADWPEDLGTVTRVTNETVFGELSARLHDLI